MRPLGAIVSAVLFCFSVGCGVSGGKCSSGSVNAALLAGASELPADFEYSAAEFRDAITGAWVDSTRDVSVTLNQYPASNIDYHIGGGPMTKCNYTQTTMQVVGEMKTSDTGPVMVSGSFYAGVRLANARLNISFGTQGCTFIYTEATETNKAKLKSDGFCNLSILRLGYAESLILIRHQ